MSAGTKIGEDIGAAGGLFTPPDAAKQRDRLQSCDCGLSDAQRVQAGGSSGGSPHRVEAGFENILHVSDPRFQHIERSFRLVAVRVANHLSEGRAVPRVQHLQALDKVLENHLVGDLCHTLILRVVTADLAAQAVQPVL